jgi:NAD(P)-dependent dehydrogenase (short-subunit alcohol dehydrogenase family)
MVFAREIFKGRVALVTGGATGIGKALAKAFAEHGADLVIASRKEDNLKSAAAELGATGAQVMFKVVDIKQPDQVDKLVGETLDRFKKIDFLINNAGANFLSPAIDISPNGWRTIIDTVLNGTFYVSRAVAKPMLERGFGRIVNMASTNAHNGSPLMVHSGAAKAGVISMTETLAVEWAAGGITVNAIAPGPVDTAGANQRLWPDPKFVARLEKRIPMGRFARPDDIVGPTLFLCSDAAAFITGATLVVDGGDRLRSPVLAE